MKKFTSILMGLAITLSAVAAPQLAKRENAIKDVNAIQQHVKKIAHRAPAQLNDEVVNIVATDLEVDDSMLALYLQYLGYGYVGIAASTDDWIIEGSLYPDTENYFVSYSSAAGDIELTLTGNEEELELTVSSAKMSKEGKSLVFTASAVDESGTSYNINLSYTVPETAKDTVILAFGPAYGKFYADEGDFYLYAERADYVAALDIYVDDETYVGEYQLDDFYKDYTGLYTVNGEDTVSVGDLFDATAKITLEDGVYQIAADLFMTDTVLYRITMSYEKPVATDTVTYTFEEPVTIDDFGGDFYFLAKDANYILVMDYYSETITGEFKLSDLYTQYVGLYTIVGTDTTKVAYEDVNLKVTEDEKKYDIEVSYLGSNLTCYLFSLQSLKAEAKDTVALNLEDAQYMDVSEYSWYYGFSHYVLAAPADSSVIVAIGIIDDEFIGSFTEANIYAANSGVQMGDDFFQIASAEFTVKAGENGSYVLEGWLLAKNNVRYEFVIKTQEDEPQAINNTNAANKVAKRLVNGQLVIEKNGVQFNAIGTIIK